VVSSVTNNTCTSPFAAEYTSLFSILVLPVLLGIVSSLITLYLTYKLQQPKWEISLANDRYDPKFDRHYVHLKVKNVSRLFLGGGVAMNCRGIITLQDGRTFVTKWANRAGPVRIELVGDVANVRAFYVVEPAYLDQAKNEYIFPGEEKQLDVAVRFKGESCCYIHEPENFLDPDYRPQKNRLPPGEYPFTVVLQYSGDRSPRFFFKIVNKDGNSPDLMFLEQMSRNPD